MLFFSFGFLSPNLTTNYFCFFRSPRPPTPNPTTPKPTLPLLLIILFFLNIPLFHFFKTPPLLNWSLCKWLNPPSRGYSLKPDEKNPPLKLFILLKGRAHQQNFRYFYFLNGQTPPLGVPPPILTAPNLFAPHPPPHPDPPRPNTPPPPQHQPLPHSMLNQTPKPSQNYAHKGSPPKCGGFLGSRGFLGLRGTAFYLKFAGMFLIFYFF